MRHRTRIKNIRVKDNRPEFKGTHRYKHYCANCGKGPYFTDFPIYYSTNVLCSKECDTAIYPAWLRWGIGLVVLVAWAVWLLDGFRVVAF